MRASLEHHLERASACGQTHIVAAAQELDEAGQARLAQSLDAVPWSHFDELQQLVAASSSGQEDAGDWTPPTALRVPEAKDLGARERGEAMLRGGEVALFTVAGGQGTRLGWNGPKGTFPATPITGKSLFQVLAERIVATQQRWGCTIRWYIMTSVENDAATRSFLIDNRCFGLDRSLVQVFPQGMMPALDAETGRLLLAAPDRLALSPDGHGGAFGALLQSGALEHMERRGVRALSWVQIDNPLVRALDPTFIGLHANEGSSSQEFSSKIVSRAHAGEKVGVFVKTPEGMAVREYSDLGPEMAAQTDESGELKWRAANIAVHMLGVEFIRTVAEGTDGSLPWHLAHKKVPFWCPDRGRIVTPESPNAVKLERFVFDALPMASRPVLLEVDRAQEFAPIKNSTGEDSVVSSGRMQIELHASWLEQAGVSIPRADDGSPQARVEVSPLCGQWPEDLDASALPKSVDAGADVLIEAGTSMS
ncbi:MAG: UDPGP type 1 family protein [Phycisphaerales bacterium]|nr:UDPGP type 1 family protein [Phycisphaerales bacterium]